MEKGKKLNWKTGGKKFKVYITIDSSGANPQVMNGSIDRAKTVGEQIKILGLVEKLSEEQTKNLLSLQVEKTILDRILKDKDGFITEWAEFNKWGWKQSNDILRSSKIEDPITGTEKIDFQLLRENKLRRLLVDWSLKEDDTTLEIKRTPDLPDSPSIITEECWKNILDVDPIVINTFLGKADLILELGQEEEENFTKGQLLPSALKEAE